MGVHDIEIETEEFGVRDGTWEGSPHGMSNARSVVLAVPLFEEAHAYPNGYFKDGYPIALMTGGAHSGKYGPFIRGGADGAGTMAGVIVDNPRVFRADGTAKTYVMSAMPDHCMVRLANLPAAGTVASPQTVVASDLPKGYIAR